MQEVRVRGWWQESPESQQPGFAGLSELPSHHAQQDTGRRGGENRKAERMFALSEGTVEENRQSLSSAAKLDDVKGSEGMQMDTKRAGTNEPKRG